MERKGTHLENKTLSFQQQPTMFRRGDHLSKKKESCILNVSYSTPRFVATSETLLFLIYDTHIVQHNVAIKM